MHPLLLLQCFSFRAPPPRLSENAVAVCFVRPGDDAHLAGSLAATLKGSGMPLLRADRECESSAEALEVLHDAASGAAVRAVFELGVCASSMAIFDCCMAGGHDFYRWTPSVGMFKRLCGDSGPAWIAAGSAGAVSEDVETEKRGWGYLSGDEERVVDTASLSDAEIATLLDLPASGTPTDDAAESASTPFVSAFGYAVRAALPTSHSPPAALTTMACEALLQKGTEPPGSYTLADGTPFPPEDAAGTYCSPLSGAPLFLTAARKRSSSGWPSFTTSDEEVHAPPNVVNDPALGQHMGRRMDYTGGVPRVECYELGTGAHLGHDFDGTLCINAASLVFVPAGHAPPAWLPRPVAPAVASVLEARPELVGQLRVATLAGGCFWNMRAGLLALPGVLAALAGFTGGDTSQPTYELVCAGGTGHVEAVQLAYDPTITSFEELIKQYWQLVPDPTFSYKQGGDVGPQYEPTIFYHSQYQREVAEATRRTLQHELGKQVVVRVRPAAESFWVASDEHQRPR